MDPAARANSASSRGSSTSRATRAIHAVETKVSRRRARSAEAPTNATSTNTVGHACHGIANGRGDSRQVLRNPTSVGSVVRVDGATLVTGVIEYRTAPVAG